MASKALSTAVMAAPTTMSGGSVISLASDQRKCDGMSLTAPEQEEPDDSGRIGGYAGGASRPLGLEERVPRVDERERRGILTCKLAARARRLVALGPRAFPDTLRLSFSLSEVAESSERILRTRAASESICVRSR